MTTNLLSAGQTLTIANYVNERGLNHTPVYQFYDVKAPNANKMLLSVYYTANDSFNWTSQPAGQNKNWLTDDAELLQVTSRALDAIER